MTIEPIRLPDARHRRGRARISGGVVGRCRARPALNKDFPGFAFTVVTIDDPYWWNPRAVRLPPARHRPYAEFLARRGRLGREQREARRPELENRIIREVGPDGMRDRAF